MSLFAAAKCSAVLPRGHETMEIPLKVGRWGGKICQDTLPLLADQENVRDITQLVKQVLACCSCTPPCLECTELDQVFQAARKFCQNPWPPWPSQPPGNSSEVGAVLIGHIHLGPCKDQFLYHLAVARRDCQMQRRAASVPKTWCQSRARTTTNF